MNEYVNWPKILSSMRSDYTETRKLFPVRAYFNRNKINIAVLIRRGEITDLYRKKAFQGIWRWVDVSWYKSILDRLVTLCGTNVAIEIFSDAYSISELSSLRHFQNTRIHLFKESKYQPFNAFHTMVMADIVICGLSSFPYFAASLSDGIKIVPPAKVRINYFPEKKTRRWIFPDENANFDTREIKKYLLQKNKFKHI